MLSDLRRRFSAIPRHGPVPVTVESLADHLTRTGLAPLRIATIITGATAGLALLLSTLGLLAALTDATRQRSRELAIRAALGASRSRIVFHAVADGLRLASIGTGIGMLSSWAVLRLLLRVFPATRVPEAWLWLAVPTSLVLIVMLAGAIPARGALLISPVTVLREET